MSNNNNPIVTDQQVQQALKSWQPKGDALTNNPRIVNSPGLAANALTSSDPNLAASTLTHAAIVNGTQQAAYEIAADSQTPHHWWDGALHVAGKSLEALGKPLEEVQKDYKYIHSLYANHGVIWGTLGVLAVAGGATAGAFLGGGMGAVLGADLAAEGLRRIGGHMDEFKQDAKNAEDENYKVSIGRDFAHGIGLANTDEGWGKFVSGGLDATFDVVMDPTMQVGKLSKIAKAGKWVEASNGGKFVPLAFRSRGAQEFLARNSLVATSPDQIEALYQAGKNGTAADKLVGSGRQYIRALDQLKDMNAGDVVAKFPELRGMADDIAKADTVEKVHALFLEVKSSGEMASKFAVGGSLMVPSRTVVRAATSKISDKLRQPGNFDDEIYQFNNAANFIVPRRVANDLGEKRWIAPAALAPWSAEKWASAFAKKTRTFSGYMPYSIDEGTLNLSTTKFDPESADAMNVVYRVMRFSMGDRAARSIVNDFAGADLAGKRSIYLDGLGKMFVAAGLPNDMKAASTIMERMAMRAEGTLGSGVYGHGYELGDEVSTVMMENASHSAALWTHQAGDWAIPDFREIKKAMRSMGTVGKMYGSVDEFAATQWTDTVFKPWALLTAGFGMRIAASELIPTFIRFGGYEVAKAKIAGAAAKMNYKLAAGEEDHIAAHVALQLSGEGLYTSDGAGQALKDIAGNASGVRSAAKRGTAKGLEKLASEEDFDLASRIAIATQGHMATGATASGHGTDLDLMERQSQLMNLTNQRMNRGMREKPDSMWQYWTPKNSHFNIYWVTNMQKASQNVAQKSILKDVLSSLDNGLSQDEAWTKAVMQEEARLRGVAFDESASQGLGAPLPKDQDTYLLSGDRHKLQRSVDEDPMVTAYKRVDDMRNLFTGADGTWHDNLARRVSNGSKPYVADVKDIDSATMPKSVIGPELEEIKAGNWRQRIVQEGFKKIIDPIVGNMSRQPLFFLHVKQVMPTYQAMIDSGAISEETALRLAMTHATQAMLPQIHNTALRTQFSVLARNYLPFYFAQEQAYKRYVKLEADNPQALRMYQLIEHGLNDPGFVETDNNGNRYLMLPGVGEMGAGVINGLSAMGIPVMSGLPLSVSGNMDSLATVLPETKLPGVSPLVAIAGNALTSIDPHFSRGVKAVIGDYSAGRPAWEQMVPSSPVRSIIKGLTADEADRSYNNALLTAIAAANYHGKLPQPNDSPTVKQEKLDAIRNNARSVFFVKALVGAISPLAPQVSNEDPGLRAEFLKLKDQHNGDYGAAMLDFIGKYGDSAIPYTVGRTEGAVKGFTMPYTNEAIDWIEQNQSLVESRYAVGAMYLVPQGGVDGDTQAIHDELLKLHLRERRTGEEFMNAIYVAQGNNAYYADKKIHDDAIAALSPDKETAKKNKALIEAENKNWSSYRDQFAAMNPVWANDNMSPEKRNNAQLAYGQLQEMFSNGTAPAGQQTELVKSLMDDFSKHQAAKAAIRGNPAVKTTLTEENDNWQAYLDQLATQEPRLATVINGVFRRLD